MQLNSNKSAKWRSKSIAAICIALTLAGCFNHPATQTISNRTHTLPQPPPGRLMK